MDTTTTTAGADASAEYEIDFVRDSAWYDLEYAKGNIVYSLEENCQFRGTEEEMLEKITENDLSDPNQINEITWGIVETNDEGIEMISYINTLGLRKKE